MRRWQLQDAKNKLSQLVDQAASEGPQVITRHGKEAVVVVSYDDYTSMTRPSEGLAAFFARSPLAGIELDVSRSTDTGRELEL